MRLYVDFRTKKSLPTAEYIHKLETYKHHGVQKHKNCEAKSK